MKHARAILAAVIGASAAAGVLLVVHPLLKRPAAPPPEPTTQQVEPAGRAFAVGGKADPELRRRPPKPEPPNPKPLANERVRRKRNALLAAQKRQQEAAEARRRAEERRQSRARAAASAPASRPATRPAAPSLNTVRQLLAAGDRALSEGDNRKAESLFRKALDKQPKNVDALSALAMALLAERDYEASIPVYQELIGLLADARIERSNLALAYARCGMYRDAQKVYRDLLRDFPDLLEARVNYAIMLYQDQGKLGDALEQWQEVARQDPSLYDAHQALGEIHTDLDHPKKAQMAFFEAVKLRPRLPGAWLNVATTSEAAGEGGAAALAYAQALKLAPYDADVWRRQGDLHLKLFRESEAKARKTDATAKGDIDLLGKAVDFWQKSLQLDGEQADLRERLKFYRPIAGKPVLDAPAP